MHTGDIVSLSIVGSFTWLLCAYLVATVMSEDDITPNSRFLRALIVLFGPVSVALALVVVVLALIARVVREIWQFVFAGPHKTKEPAAPIEHAGV
ncbi:MAG TPA: hypothetical protein VG992_00545 [Candidatus Saccharimonadales bacterium]|nr:hypothetical protein [Candidatus Saccharimonadales bacterium]